MVKYTTQFYICFKIDYILRGGKIKMRDEYLEERENMENEYEVDDEMNPEMQGFMQGWRDAGDYNKEDKSDLFSDEEE